MKSSAVLLTTLWLATACGSYSGGIIASVSPGTNTSPNGGSNNPSGANATPTPPHLNLGIVSTFAGNASTGLDGFGSAAHFYSPAGVGVDKSNGNIYVADSANFTIRKITPDGTVTTLAGELGVSGYADGNGIQAHFNICNGIVVDSTSNVYVADTGNQIIRKITPAGDVTTFAGNPGVSGLNDANGTGATFNGPIGLAIDTSDNLYVADSNNNAIRKITPAGDVTTFAGSLTSVSGYNDASGNSALFAMPTYVAADPANNLFVADYGNNVLRKIDTTGVVTTFAGIPGTPGTLTGAGTVATFDGMHGLTVDSVGNIYLVDDANYIVRKITSAAVVSNLAGLAGTSGSADGSGNGALFGMPFGIAIDASGNIYVSDKTNNDIRRMNSIGSVSTFVGGPSSTDGSGASARFSAPAGLAVDSSGNVFVADQNENTIRKITPSGVVSTFAGTAGTSGTVDASGTAALFNYPSAICADAADNLFVADTFNHTIRKITSAGVVTTFAGIAGTSGSFDAPGTSATFNSPQAITCDKTTGSLYVADTGNYIIRKITSAGVVTTIAGTAGVYGSTDSPGAAASFTLPSGIIFDSKSGYLFVTDTGNGTIRKLSVTGSSVSTFVGIAGNFGDTDDTGAAASFNSPTGITVDSFGNLYVSDNVSNTIRKITPAAVVSTFAGVSNAYGSTDGTGAAALFGSPQGLAVDQYNNLFVSDAGNFTIREIK